jgi:NADPH2:quinone reductase
VRAVRCVRLGDLADLVVEDLPDLVPGPGEVVVRLGAAAANFPDVLLVQGRYQVKVEAPFTVGSEFAGTVCAVGEGVTTPALGERVTGSGITGAFAEQVLIPAFRCTSIPDGVDDETAAAQGVTYVTSFHALHTVGELQAGQWVVVLGAGGGVGLAAVELAHRHGAHVVAAAAGQAKLDACRAIGADVVVDYATTDLKAAIKEATGGGAHLVVDPVGGQWAEPALRALRPGGRYVVVGFASGSIPSFPLNLLLVKGVSVHGLDLRHVGADLELHGRAVATLRQMLADGLLRPHIGGRYPLAGAGLALADLAGRRAVGKLLILP